MVAATQSTTKKGKQSRGAPPKTMIGVRASQRLKQDLDNYLASQDTKCSRSSLMEALLTKALESPKWIHIEHYDKLPAGKRSYTIFDRFNSEVEMGRVDNLYEYVANHPKLERFLADKYRIIYFA